jgi:CheR methyltransferase, all-alpha domain
MTESIQTPLLEYPNDPIAISAATFDRFARFVNSELGIKMPDSKVTMLQSRLMRRVRELGLGSLNHYAEYFFSSLNGEEREHLINAITINKTDFFGSQYTSTTSRRSCSLGSRATRFAAAGLKPGRPDAPPAKSRTHSPWC